MWRVGWEGGRVEGWMEMELDRELRCGRFQSEMS